MKRALELVSFVSFVSFVMWIILNGVAPVKNVVYNSGEKTSAKLVLRPKNLVILKAGAKASTSLSLLTPAYK